ncbi:ABC-type Mn2+/Zn2+ transport system, permease component [Peptoclostridium acidaminophilum DSM 3953]|uniref:ABC-type Mn2+/Zn2+ transport system, permease component n=1 Tax=Peptoclostridium acidaminophilum DSM 3953 TaxID=1286171 RepID=W8TLB0_PEPAC|nr:ABC-type Mn2+/Zn2+ transport system, permease component [Peptoclostridium acidaminophilum DSM 3953]
MICIFIIPSRRTFFHTISQIINANHLSKQQKYRICLIK